MGAFTSANANNTNGEINSNQPGVWVNDSKSAISEPQDTIAFTNTTTAKEEVNLPKYKKTQYQSRKNRSKAYGKYKTGMFTVNIGHYNKKICAKIDREDKRISKRAYRANRSN